MTLRWREYEKNDISRSVSTLRHKRVWNRSATTLRRKNIRLTPAGVGYSALTAIEQWTRCGVTHLAVEHFAVAGAAIADCGNANCLAAAPQSFYRWASG